MNQEKMGKFIAERRKAVNLTQKSLSEKLNVNEKTVSKWERGINAPDIALLTDLAEILDVTVNELLSGEKEDNKKKMSNNRDNQITIEGIKFYNKKSKFRYIKFSMVIIATIILIFASLFTINNFNQFKVYNINSRNNDFDIDGYIIFNQEKNIIFFKPIIYTDKYVGTSKEIKSKEIKLELLLNDKVIYNEVKKEKELKNISEILNNFIIFIEEDTKSHEYIISEEDDLTNLRFELTYLLEEEQITIKIPVTVEEIYSNNKLFY